MLQPTPTEQALIHPAYVRLLYVLLKEKGVDVDALFHQVGLCWTGVAADPSLLKFETFGRLVLAVQTHLQCPWVGLDLGAYGQASVHGVVGHAAVSSANLRQVLATLSKYGHLRCDALGYAFTESHRGGRFSVVVNSRHADVRQFLYEAAFATLMRLTETAVGNAFSAMTVELPFPKPAWSDRYLRYGLREVRFDATELSLCLTPDSLDLHCLTADTSAHGSASRECERLLVERAGVTFAQRVDQHLRASPGQHANYPELGALASQLNVSPRTLMRKLKLEGTSYQKLLDGIRQEQALSALRHSTHSIENIAHRLGYQDASNFSRTFRRWSGQTPREVRKNTVLTSAKELCI